MSNTLHAHYVFYSPTTLNTYVLALKTQPLTSNIETLDNPDCTGYPVISGTFTVAPQEGSPTGYPVPGGATPFIYNGLWPNADECPDGAGTVLCQGIDRLFVNFSQSSGNTLVAAASANSISINFGTGNPDTAQLLHFIFPPQ